MHQLVSSQLDIDRLDYLNRDSFFTGVAEGVIGYDRIIKMLAVHDNELVVEEKGIYSIEKFLISRRLMYWQVYLHKTVLVAEQMLMQIMKRARRLLQEKLLLCSPTLHWFLRHEVSQNNFIWNEEITNRFADLDDSDIFSALKVWSKDEDKVLAYLCSHLLNRKLLKIELVESVSEEKRVAALKSAMIKFPSIATTDYEWLIFSESTSNHAYNPTAESIKILFKNGELKDISEASDLLDISALKIPLTKYYVCFPQELVPD